MVLGQMNIDLTQILFSYFICSCSGFNFTINRKRLEIILP